MKLSRTLNMLWRSLSSLGTSSIRGRNIMVEVDMAEAGTPGSKDTISLKGTVEQAGTISPKVMVANKGIMELKVAMVEVGMAKGATRARGVKDIITRAEKNAGRKEERSARREGKKGGGNVALRMDITTHWR
jgi:hypothetical protein